MKLTLVHPAMGHRPGERYIRAWQMETLPAAAIAGLTPRDVEIAFYDDRMEEVPLDAPCDAVAMSVETYTAGRARHLAREYRRRNVPVVMGGFHATLAPDEVAEYADAVVVGEAESVWKEVVDDLRHGTLKRRYRAATPPDLRDISVDRSIFRSKNYLPVTLIETGRGCRYACEFCAIGAFFGSTRRQRPTAAVLEEIAGLKDRTRLFFFVDDNFAAAPDAARELMRALRPLKIRWVTQMSLPAALDGDFLQDMVDSGCIGVLVGIESLDETNLAAMNKSFNAAARSEALDNLSKYGIGVYGTFVFGYDGDREETFDRAVDFALERRFYIAAFNHLTPFPGTPLYDRLKAENRLTFDKWWLDERYRYNDLAFRPARMAPEEISRRCVDARRRFYSWRNILGRLPEKANRNDFFKLRNYLPINLMHRWDVSARNGYPIGRGRDDE